MAVHLFSSRYGIPLEVDVCSACQVLWFDNRESSQLSPRGVLDLFDRIHGHEEDARLPLKASLNCPRCATTLQDGVDVVSSGRYITYRCPMQHGRVATFTSFLIEKGFVRQMTPVEVRDLARKVAVIHCFSCGSPVDIRKDAACPFCRSPFSLLDPTAVEKAVEKYKADLASPDPVVIAGKLADGLIELERQRAIARREEEKEKGAKPFDNVISDVVVFIWRVFFRR